MRPHLHYTVIGPSCWNHRLLLDSRSRFGHSQDANAPTPESSPFTNIFFVHNVKCEYLVSGIVVSITRSVHSTWYVPPMKTIWRTKRDRAKLSDFHFGVN